MSDAVLTPGALALPRPAAAAARKPLRLRGASAYALVGPAFVLMLLMLIGPLCGVIALSFTDYQLGAPSFAWIGLANYQDMFADRTFWISLTNTLTYVVVVVPGSVVLGLGVALLIQSGTAMLSNTPRCG